MPETPTRDALTPSETQLPDVRGFVVHAVLGRGCVGTTYHATQLATGHIVALKLLHPHVVVLRATSARIETLTRSLAGLDHATLTRFGELGSLPGTRVHYCVAEYIDGAPLTQRLSAPGCSIRQIVEAFCALLSALAEAHRHGVLHLGIRPSNVLMTRHAEGKPQVRVCDLGLNRLLKFEAPSGVLTLSRPEQLRYWSPEQLQGRDLDGRADIFGVGALLYEALTGAPAFERETAEATVRAICEGEPMAPSLRCPERRIPRELEAVCLRALRRAPEDRFRSPIEMSQALRASLEILSRRADLPLGPAFEAASVEPVAASRATMPGDQLPSRTALGLGAVLLLSAAAVLYTCTRGRTARVPRSAPTVSAPTVSAPTVSAPRTQRPLPHPTR